MVGRGLYLGTKKPGKGCSQVAGKLGGTPSIRRGARTRTGLQKGRCQFGYKGGGGGKMSPIGHCLGTRSIFSTSIRRAIGRGGEITVGGGVKEGPTSETRAWGYFTVHQTMTGIPHRGRPSERRTAGEWQWNQGVPVRKGPGEKESIKTGACD